MNNKLLTQIQHIMEIQIAPINILFQYMNTL